MRKDQIIVEEDDVRLRQARQIENLVDVCRKTARRFINRYLDAAGALGRQAGVTRVVVNEDDFVVPLKPGMCDERRDRIICVRIGMPGRHHRKDVHLNRFLDGNWQSMDPLKLATFGAVYVIFDDDRWLHASLESVYEDCDVILVRRPYDESIKN